uniref:Uncharacterized protein n=1 Tax=Romanomermis culicivorax TaxID=13658 RepID=A0A915I0N0_ROMCU
MYPDILNIICTLHTDGRALLFKAFWATESDWTAFSKHFDNTHTIVGTFDADKDWCALYTLVVFFPISEGAYLPRPNASFPRSTGNLNIPMFDFKA